jgi:hypothetical protein
MKAAFITMIWTVSCALFLGSAHGQSITVKTEQPTSTFTNTEPARIALADLFRMSDVVAVVKIVSGDTENYKTAIYKASVVTSFKGTTNGKTIFFGPFIGYRLGSEYILFLRDTKKTAAPVGSPAAGYGSVNAFEVFNQGYSAMDSSYECVFKGPDAQEFCGDAVRVCTDYITLPKNVAAYPPEQNDPPFGCRWVRKSEFLLLLNEFSQPSGLRMP